jgi:hypothetical protein
MVSNKGFDGSIQCLIISIDGWQETKPMRNTIALRSRGRQSEIVNEGIDALQDVHICGDQIRRLLF